MLVSKQWIEQFTTIPKRISPKQLGEDLTLHVVEVEDVIDEAQFLDGIVVGKIVEVSAHPNADALRLTKVDIGKEVLPVVCGGSNLEVGMLIAMGMIGAQVRWHGEGELIELKEAKIRGEVSMGMICAAEEIGLGDMFPKQDEKEILDFTSRISKKTKLGTPVAHALGLDDIVYDIDNKSMTHRPDLWGHYGMAREVAAMYGQEVKEYLPAKIKSQDPNHKIHITVKAPTLCTRYMAVALDHVVVGPSPAWLEKRLMSVGISPKNNIVDITNYVMFELGQPMHAFDATQLKETNNKKQDTPIHITIRKAKEGEQFTSLDEKAYTLTTDDLVIATKNNVLALAGVKGSKMSGVTDETTSIVLESAHFDAVSVRRTATRHGLRTDASARFEKSLDPVECDLALRRAVALILEVCPSARVSSTVVDQASFEKTKKHISLDTGFVRKRMGVDLPTKQMVHILTSLGFGVKESKKAILTVTVPTWRATKDIALREDLVEEIARVYGYDNISPTLPTFPIVPPKKNALRECETTLRELLAYQAGYTEVSNYSFVSPELLKKCGMVPSDHIALDNPIAKDRPYLRTSLAPNMLEVVEKNLHRFETVQIFEIGKVFDAHTQGVTDGQKGMLPKQDTYLALAYAKKGEDVPFRSLSTRMNEVFDRLGMTLEYRKKSKPSRLFHPGRYAEIVVSGIRVGHIGDVHPLVAEHIGLDARTAVAELNLSEIVPLLLPVSRYTPLSPYPRIERDVAFLVDTSVAHSDIARALIEADDLAVHVALFDVYTGGSSASAQDKIPEGKKSMGYRITYQARDRTLESSEVDAVHTKIVKMLETTFGATIR